MSPGRVLDLQAILPGGRSRWVTAVEPLDKVAPDQLKQCRSQPSAPATGHSDEHWKPR